MRWCYDADEEVGLSGKPLAEQLPAIYGERAAAVVVFISAEYAARDWTRLERRAALARAVRPAHIRGFFRQYYRGPRDLSFPATSARLLCLARCP